MNLALVEVDSAPLMAAALILTFSITWFLHKTIKSGKYRNAVSPPGPRGLPIVGYFPFLRRDLHYQLTELAAEYGPIYKLRLGSKLCTVISSASLAKEVFRDHDAVFANHDATVAARIASLDFNDITWSPYGQEWRDRRKILAREMLSNTNLKASSNLRKDQVRNAVKEIYAAQIGTPVTILDLVLRLDLNLMINMIWGGNIGGERCHRISAGLAPVVAEIQDFLIKPNVSDFFPVLARFDVQGVAKKLTPLMQKVVAIMEDAIDESMMKNRDAGVGEEGRKDFMQTLVDLMKEETHKASLGVVQIKAMLLNVLIGGTDTTSTIMEWVMAELLNHPKVMEKVQQELNEVVGMNNVVEETHIPKLVYLDAVIKETMRVHPIGPLLPRTPSRDCTVGGYTIPKDSAVFVNVWSIQRDPAVWDNASEFRPERFLEGESSSGKKWDFSGKNSNYTPFGSGRRICAGLPLADIMLRYILASLLHSFEWGLRDGEELDMSDEIMSALRKRIPLVAIPLPRLPCSDLYQ
nr:cytochrome P450 706V17 [Isodon rubescens]